ncbi:PTS transporter subunit EIIC [Erysipelothrix inopinata]|uniref:PTS transporter subunit EIIC n=1 Tax=Erysipelothrix inopinata TaxID=225084 RepID=A0A7G9RYU1_9FIRM|nr:alpha-glucoside-specific PTS transporter subunit IIBC [Erysipelothrix inopinata]QNN60766.1 PTS transporter subunit EIIC [Erysipelothrix inopinata]
MMQKVQRFGGAMFTPVMLFAFSGIMIGLSTVFQTELIVGSIAHKGTLWYNIWFVIKEGAYAVFRQVPMLFVVGLPIGLAKKQNARACMEALVLYFTFNYFLAAILTIWGPQLGVDMTQGEVSGLATIASTLTLDTGVIGALVVAGVSVAIHDRFFDFKLPEWLGTFKGSSFVVIVGFFVMLPIAALFAIIWPKVQDFMGVFQELIVTSGYFGVWIYTFLERMLIPTGLHHFIYMPFTLDNAVIDGGIKAQWLIQLENMAVNPAPLKEQFPAGAYSLYGMAKIFGPAGITAAFYSTAKENKKKQVLGLMIPVSITALIAGVTEPIEFTFLFMAPILFVAHSALAATLATVANMFGVVGYFTSGILNWITLNWLPLGPLHWRIYVVQIAVGLVFTVIWFVVFRFLILKLDLKTPGREDDDEEMRLVSKKEYKESRENKKFDLENTENDPTASIGISDDAKKAALFLQATGGKDNIVDVTNCATRLRLTVVDETLVAPLKTFQEIGAHGLVSKGKAIQIIVGMQVPHIRDEFEELLK